MELAGTENVIPCLSWSDFHAEDIVVGMFKNQFHMELATTENVIQFSSWNWNKDNHA